MKKVLVLGHVLEDGFALIDARDDISYEHVRECDEETLIGLVRDVDAIAVRTAQLTSRVIQAAASLKVVSRHGVGYDNVPVDELTKRRIPLTVAVHANAISVAEHTMYFLLALAKQGPRYDEATRRGDFQFRNTYLARDVAGRRLLLVGLGRIGTRVAKRALAFDMKVLAYDPFLPSDVIVARGCEVVSDLSEGLARADALSVHCPLTDATRGLIGEKALRTLPSHAHVINCARGGIIDEEALRRALLRHDIAGAALDVFEAEPPDPGNRLFELNNVIISPHSAGVSAEAARRMSEETIANVIAAFDEELDPAVVVNREVLRRRD